MRLLLALLVWFLRAVFASRGSLAQLHLKTFSTHPVANATAAESLNFPSASVVPFSACASVTGGPPSPGAEPPLPPGI
jgi:hypothetical protein